MKTLLVACEESQRVCTAFRQHGWEAYSCDIIDCSGGHPEYHIKQDVLPLLSRISLTTLMNIRIQKRHVCGSAGCQNLSRLRQIKLRLAHMCQQGQVERIVANMARRSVAKMRKIAQRRFVDLQRRWRNNGRNMWRKNVKSKGESRQGNRQNGHRLSARTQWRMSLSNRAKMSVQ